MLLIKWTLMPMIISLRNQIININMTKLLLSTTIFFLFSFHFFAQVDILNEVAQSAGTELTRLIKELNPEAIFKQKKIISEQITEIKDLKERNLSFKKETDKLKSDLEKNKSENEKALNSRLKAEKKDLLLKISDSYSGNTLEYLIKNFNKIIVKRDGELLTEELKNNPLLKQKFEKLLAYFDAEQLLHDTYEEGAVNLAIKKLDQIRDSSVSIIKLNKNLKNYGIRYKGFNECINQINEIDSDGNAGTNQVIKEKKIKRISYEVAKYIKDYELTYHSCPYISEVLIRIIDNKMRNPDKNINEIIKN